jgi:hypothetical protein
MMHLLERVAAQFNQAGVPLLLLKGAALNLTLYRQPDERPMADLDLLIRPEDIGKAFALLEKLGGLRGEPLVREDFFPRFHYETDYSIGKICPVNIDLHVRPFRPLRYSRLVPADALWDRAEPVGIGQATVLVPSAEDMLIHLAAHAAIHGCSRRKWLQDIRDWADARRSDVNWDLLLATVDAWRLALPVREAWQRVEREFGQVGPPEVSRRLGKLRANWRDRLALWQAPRDADHSVSHVAVNLLCTPGRRFVLAYLSAMIVPDRAHMSDWYCRRHWAWLPCAHVCRWLWPIIGRIGALCSWLAKIETRPSRVHGIGVFATRDIAAGELIARYHGKQVHRNGMYVVRHKDRSGQMRRFELTGKLKFLNHSCSPHAELAGFKLVALRPIRAGDEIRIDYGAGTCTCKPNPRQGPGSLTAETFAEVA